MLSSNESVDAFDADVLVYAAARGHVLGRRVLALLGEGPGAASAGLIGIGSLLLVPEMPTRPTRDGADDEIHALAALLGRLELRPVDEATAELAVALGVTYRLRAADAIQLATAVGHRAERFTTNNQRDFPRSIEEVDVIYPMDLPEPTDALSS